MNRVDLNIFTRQQVGEVCPQLIQPDFDLYIDQLRNLSAGAVDQNGG